MRVAIVNDTDGVVVNVVLADSLNDVEPPPDHTAFPLGDRSRVAVGWIIDPDAPEGFSPAPVEPEPEPTPDPPTAEELTAALAEVAALRTDVTSLKGRVTKLEGSVTTLKASAAGTSSTTTVR